MKFVSVDQSFNSCAITFWENHNPLNFTLAKTSSAWVKSPNKKDVTYFPIITQQIDFIVERIFNSFIEHKAEFCILESPAQASFGDAVAGLKTLFRAIREKFRLEGFEDKLLSITPTGIKSYAREFLPEEDRISGLTKAGKPKKRKMEKKDMYKACQLTAPEGWLDNHTVSNSGGDLADSFWLGHMFYYKMYQEGKC